MEDDDEHRRAGSTDIEVTPDGRVIIRAEISTAAQMRALKVLIDSLEQRLFERHPDPGGNSS